MTPLPTTCPKCSGRLVHGFSVEFGGPPQVASWVEGEPEKAWLGTKVPPRSEHIPIAMLRCSGCGYLESYARPEFAAK
jgi:hypothetical protein